MCLLSIETNPTRIRRKNMFKRVLQIGSASMFGLTLLANSGCCSTSRGSYVQAPCKAPCGTKVADCGSKPTDPCVRPAGELTAELPPHAKPGECWAKVYVPPTF